DGVEVPEPVVDQVDVAVDEARYDVTALGVEHFAVPILAQLRHRPDPCDAPLADLDEAVVLVPRTDAVPQTGVDDGEVVVGVEVGPLVAHWFRLLGSFTRSAPRTGA